MVKVTDVSEGGGPEVSSTNSRARGSTLGAVGVAGLSGTEGARPPQAMTALTAAKSGQLAATPNPRDIAPFREVRFEGCEVRGKK